MKPKGTSRLFTGSAALIVASFITSSAYAASATWSGTTNASWATTTNWTPNTVPGGVVGSLSPADIATFNSAGNGNTVIDLAGTAPIAGVVFDSSSLAAYTLGSGAVGSQSLPFATASSVTLTNTVTTNQLVNANVSLSNAAAAATTFSNNSTGLLSFAGTIAANVASGNGVLTVNGTGNTTITGAITKPGAGSNALLKTGSGTLTLSNGSVWNGAGAIGRVPSSSGYPLVAREGVLLLNGGTHTVTGELVVGGVVADGGPGQNAKIQLDAGTLAISSWLSLGRGNGVGAVSSDIVVNNSGAITTADFSAGFQGGGAANMPKGSFTLNNSSSFTINANGAFNLGESTGSNMTMTVNGTAQVNAAGTGIKRIGNSGTGVLNINDSGNVNFGNQLVYLGYRTGNGTVNMTGGTFATAGEVRVGGSDTNNGAAENAVGTLNISGGVANFSGLTIARGNNNVAVASGSATVSGGTLNVVNDVVLGYAGSNNLGKLTISGGTMNVGTTATKWFCVGQWDTSKGELDVTSGSLRLLNGTSIKMNRDNTVGANVINQSGGAITFYSDAGTTVGGAGHLDLQRVGAAASSNTYNLDGGVLTVPQVISTVTSGFRTFNFNGGTLKAAVSQAAFFNLGAGNAFANVRNGGAKIDTNGFDVTVSQPLLHSPLGEDAAVDGGLTKSSAGTLRLTGASTYTGPTLVTGGTLVLGSGANIDTSSSITINGGAKLVQPETTVIASPVTLAQGSLDASGSITSLTVGNAVGNTISIGNGGTATLFAESLTFQGAATVNVAAAGSDMIRNIQAGALTSNSAGQVVINATNTSGFWSPGDYRVIEYSSLNGNNFTLGTITGLSGGQEAVLVDVNGAITLRITGDLLTWTGDQSSNWTTDPVGGSKNWKYPTTGATAEYGNGSPVVFNDMADNSIVDLGTNVSPTITIFDNSDAKTYTVSSAGGSGISGGAILKSNTGTAVLSTTNTTTGIVTITGGILQIGNGTTDGSIAASTSIVNNAALNYQTAGNQSISNPITGTGVTTMTGTGALTLAGANAFTGGGIGVASGTLNVNHASAIGSTTGGSLIISGGILNNTSGGAITTTTAKTQTWSGDFTFAGSNNLNFNGGTVTLSNGGSRTVNVAAGTLGTGNITSPDTGLSLTGPGLLAITSGTASNIAGTLDVAAGSKLRLNTGADTATTSDFIATGLTGNGTIENGGGVERWLFANPATDQTFAGLLQNGAVGPLGFNKGGTATLTLTGTNTYTGRTTITSGTLSVATLTNGGIAGPIGAGGVDPAGLYIGNNGTGTLLYTGSDVTLDRGFTTGGNAGNSGIIETNANMTFTGAVAAANAGGFVKRGTGTLTLSNSSAGQKLNAGGNGGGSVFGVNVARGRLVLKNGAFSTTGELVVGGQLQTDGAYHAAFLDITNAGSLTVPSWVSIGRGNGDAGLSSVLTVDGGTLNQSLDTAGLAMGYEAAVPSFNVAPVLNIKGASSVTVAGSLNVGESSGSDATVNMEGTSSATLNLTNGTIANKSIGVSGKGTLNITSGLVNAGVGLTVGKNEGSEGAIHLNGGVLDTGALVGGAGISRIYLNGGTIRANATNAAFIAVTNVDIEAGGVVIDTQSSYTITIPQVLNAGATGTGGVTKDGVGSLILGGANSYLGNTTINSGTFTLADNGGLTFVPGANGVSNKVTGLGSATFDGDFTINLSGAAVANGNSWTLVDTTTKSFTTNFTVIGFDDSDLDNKWTKVEGANTWTFDEATGKLTLSASGGSGYSSWAGGFGLGAGDQDPTDDPDHDGLTNLVEYVLGGNPSQSSTSILPTAHKDGANYVFTFKRSDASEADTTQFVEYGDNLTVWGSIAIGASPGSGAVSISENTPSADVDTVTVTIPTAGATKFFARLKVVK